MFPLHQASRIALASALIGVFAGCTVQAATAPEVNQVAPAAEVPGDGAANTIVVTGSARKQAEVSAGALGSRSLFETPFSVGEVNAEAIQKIAATTIDAAFVYDAGVRSNNSGVASGNTFSVRGIAIDRTNGYKVDGLPWPYWFQDHPIEHLQDLQILKGAGGFAYGFAAPGGVVNLVSKQPTREFQALFNVSYRTDSILREHIDIGGPLDRDGDTAFRLNAANEEGRLYNGAYNKDQFVSLALTGHVTDKLTWQLDGFYQRTRQDDQVNTIAITTAATKVNGTKYGPVTALAPTGGNLEPGARRTSKFNDVASLTGRINYQLAPDWKANFAARYASLDERFPGSLATIYNNAGDYYSTVYNMNRLFKYYVTDAQLSGTFSTGPITHHILVGGSTLTSQFLYDNPTRNFVLGPNNNATVPVLGTSNAYVFNIYNANAVPTLAGNTAALLNNRPPVWTLYQDIHQRAAFASDTATWGPISVLIGARYTDYEEINYNPNQSLTSYFHYHPISPVVSADLAVTHGVRLYATYVDALQRGGIAPASAINANASFGPLKTTQYEAGIKSEGRWGNASLAVFRIGTPSEYVDAASNTFVRNGKARYQGVEFNAGVRPIHELVLNTSAAWLDAKQISGPTSGQTIPGTTGFQISEQFDYALPFLPGVSVNGGVRHSGKSYGVGDIFVYQPSTVGDLGGSYAFTASDHAVVLRAYVQNLTDVRYWVPGSAGTSISAGAPRTITVSAQIALQPDHPGVSVAPIGGDDDGRVGHAYLELDGGGAIPHSFAAAINNRVDNTAAAPGSIRIAQKAGWDVGGVLGYDLGRFSAEIETGFKRFKNGAIDYANTNVAVDAGGEGAGVHGNGGGRTGVLSVLFNGLINIGDPDAATRGFVGGGAGLARVSTGQWTLDRTKTALITSANPAAAATPTYFSEDNATAFAWQGLAGVRQKLSNHVDLVIKYRYFQIPSLTLRTTNGNQLKGNLFGNSVLAGIAFEL